MTGVKVDIKSVNIAIASKTCLACKNYRATHKDRGVSYCDYGSKTVFKDSGCSQWENFQKSE